jgi:hypothetical protein
MVVGGLLLVSVVLGLQRATGQASVPVNNSAPNTTMVGHLARAYDRADPTIIQATADITGTNTALLAASLLLDQPYFLVSLPLINK